jgi:hypothetical protein
MKTRYIITNIDETTQRIQDGQGKSILIEPGQSFITTRLPLSNSFIIEEISEEVERMKEKLKSGTEKKHKEVKK